MDKNSEIIKSNLFLEAILTSEAIYSLINSHFGLSPNFFIYVYFSCLKLNYNNYNIKDIEKENQNAGEEKNNNENLLNNIKPDLNTEKESGKDDINSSGEKDLVNDEIEKNDDIKNSDKEINDNEDGNNIPDD